MTPRLDFSECRGEWCVCLAEWGGGEADPICFSLGTSERMGVFIQIWGLLILSRV